MGSEKHPVSFLQELMMQQRKAPPQYDIVNTNQGFTCNVTIDGITSSATAASKQLAKYEAAAKAVAIIRESSGTPLISFNTPPIQSLAKKHPVSALQEIMAKQRKPMPTYNISDLSTLHSPRFKCSLLIEGMSFESEAPSKQIARAETAEKALKHLLSSSSIQDPTISDSTIENCCSGPEYNAIGVLNEFLQKNALPPAIYNLEGMNEKQEFIVRCSVSGKVTRGCGTQKKLGKQEAALKMLQLLDVNSPTSPKGQELSTSEQVELPTDPALNKTTPSSPKAIPDSMKDDTAVLSKYTEMMNERALQSMISGHAKMSVKNEPTELLHSNVDMFNYLNQQKVYYKFNIIQKDPFIISLNFEDSKRSTILGMGETYDEALTEALKKACELKIDIKSQE